MKERKKKKKKVSHIPHIGQLKLAWYMFKGWRGGCRDKVLTSISKLGTQVSVGHLPCTYKAPSSIPSTRKKISL